MWHESSHTGHALRQLQNRFQVVVDGELADTDITVTGVKVGDVVEVVQFAAGVPSIPAGAVTVTEADTIQIASSTDSTKLLVTVYPRSN